MVSLIAVVFAVLTMPFTRKATTAIIRMQATPRVTTISTIVNPTFGAFFEAPSLPWGEHLRRKIMARPAQR